MANSQQTLQLNADAARAAMRDLERAVLATITSADLTGSRTVSHAIVEVLR